MSDILITKHKGPTYIQMGIIVAVAIPLLVVMRTILNAFNDIVHVDLSGAILLIRLIALVLTVLCVYACWYFGNNREWKISGDTLQITDISPLGGRHTESVRLKGMNAVNIRQSALGKSMGYGTVTIKLDYLSGHETYVLPNIENPEEVKQQLRNLMSND